MKKLIMIALMGLAGLAIIPKADAYTYTLVEGKYFNINVPPGYTIVSVSEPFTPPFTPFTYIRVYLQHNTTGTVAVWTMNISNP